MKTKLRQRHYCDFCKKSGGSRYHMERHEKYCTMNPKRECRMCETARDISVQCPACRLADFRQGGGDYPNDYDYKREVKEFWEVANKEQREQEDRLLVYEGNL